MRGSTIVPPGPMIEELGLRKNSAIRSSLVNSDRSGPPRGRCSGRSSSGGHCKLRAMLKPLGLTHGHYECRSLGETLPVLTDLLAMRVLERANGQAVLEHPNTAWRLVVHEAGAAA